LFTLQAPLTSERLLGRQSAYCALAPRIRPRRRVLRPGARVWRWWPSGGRRV
jgi:hypothetical protein